MKTLARNVLAVRLLALVPRVMAQSPLATSCPTSDVCFSLNIPDATASSGSGDIFFQLSAPNSYEYIALGQGDGMVGSNIFVVYTSGDGNNVTVSPRLATRKSMPLFNQDAQVTLLEGSGVVDGKMVANVRCSNCDSWSGGTADFAANTGSWVWAASSSGGPKNSDDQEAEIGYHDERAVFDWDYATATGGNDVNPLLTVEETSPGSDSDSGSGISCVPRPQSAIASSTPVQSGTSGTSTGAPSSASASPSSRPYGPPGYNNYKRQEINYCDDSTSVVLTPSGGSGGLPENLNMMLIAHGVLASLAFVIFFPAGAIAIRLASFPGVIWLHAAFQMFAYVVYIAAFGIGIWMANGMNLLNSYHPIIGIVVFVMLFFQPITGFIHHSMFKKHQRRSLWSHAHLWLGRTAITLGIINGGLGFMLADFLGMGSRSGMIAYAVVAGVVWVAWVAAIVAGGKKKAGAGSTALKPTESPRSEMNQTDTSHGH